MADVAAAAADALLRSILPAEPSRVNEFKPNIVLPGDKVTETIQNLHTSARIGRGLEQDGSEVIATKSGVMRFRTPNNFWIENNQKRYVPVVRDEVVARVQGRFGDFYNIDIGGSQYALLAQIGFDGASRRNKPNLKAGDVLYCRMIVANRHTAPEVTCKVGNAKLAKDWVTGLSVFGQLHGGYLLKVSLAYSRLLRSSSSNILDLIGAHLPFEVAVGANGYVWINAAETKQIVCIAAIIRNAEHMHDQQQLQVMVRTLIRKLK